jgi:hypothetical protein
MPLANLMLYLTPPLLLALAIALAWHRPESMAGYFLRWRNWL